MFYVYLAEVNKGTPESWWLRCMTEGLCHPYTTPSIEHGSGYFIQLTAVILFKFYFKIVQIPLNSILFLFL